MTELPLERLAEFLDGHVGLLARGNALQPLRMPVADRHLHDRFTRWVAAIPSGVRLRLRTDSRSLNLSTQQRQAWRPDLPEWPSAYDLFIDGERVRRVSAEGGARRIPMGEMHGDEHATLALIRERHRQTPKAIVSPFLLQAGEDKGDQQGLSAPQMRVMLEEMVATHRAAGDAALHHVDGLSLFGPAEAHLQPDGVHPNAEGYRLIGERFHAAMLAPGSGLALS